MLWKFQRIYGAMYVVKVQFDIIYVLLKKTCKGRNNCD